MIVFLPDVKWTWKLRGSNLKSAHIYKRDTLSNTLDDMSSNTRSPTAVDLAEHKKKDSSAGQLAFTHPAILCGLRVEMISFTFNQYCQGPRGSVARCAPPWIDAPQRSRVNDKQLIFRWVPRDGGGKTSACSRSSQGRPTRSWHAHIDDDGHTLR